MLPAVSLTLALGLAGCGGPTQADPDRRAGLSAVHGTPSSTEKDVLSRLPAQLAADGTTVVVGDPAAPHTVRVHSDFRCPFCARFESVNGAVLARAAAKGGVKVEYVLTSFLDGRLGGHGSRKATNAARAALEAGRFPEFHAALFARQPDDELTDAYTDERLLRIADEVPGLRGEVFDRAVRGSAYQDWVAASQVAHEKSGVRTTPTVLVDGARVADQVKYDSTAFAKLLESSGVPL
ncbi:DsbA family protein [Kitasatospora sp. NPDC008050]|uniref:DsbA family protein n=1 Tax=Kitasatospora sp. NPDC008050 TaxID=3364021 RepID=UPI0036EBD164